LRRQLGSGPIPLPKPSLIAPDPAVSRRGGGAAIPRGRRRTRTCSGSAASFCKQEVTGSIPVGSILERPATAGLSRDWRADDARRDLSCLTQVQTPTPISAPLVGESGRVAHRTLIPASGPELRPARRFSRQPAKDVAARAALVGHARGARPRHGECVGGARAAPTDVHAYGQDDEQRHDRERQPAKLMLDHPRPSRSHTASGVLMSALRAMAPSSGSGDLEHAGVRADSRARRRAPARAERRR
jgi:hypothetical protein